MSRGDPLVAMVEMAERVEAAAGRLSGPTGRAGSSGSSGSVVGVGVDLVDVDRLRRVLARRGRMADRLFTPGERAYAAAAVDPVPRLSTRFAAKEATMKALGVGLGAFAFTEVEVVRTGLGAPTLRLSGGADRLAHEAGVVRWHLSLTHTEGLAAALVVAEGRVAPPSPATP